MENVYFDAAGAIFYVVFFCFSPALLNFVTVLGFYKKRDWDDETILSENIFLFLLQYYIVY